MSPKTSTTLRASALPAVLVALSVAAIAGATRTARVDSGSESPATVVEVAPTTNGAADAIDLAFITHLDADLPEQDVFIERVPGSGEVFRVTKGDHNMNAPLYRTAVALAHDPFNPNAVGPHPKGDPLGVTLGEWLKHQGSGTYTCANGEGTLDAKFSGLVPNGLYTMWHVFMAMPPTTPFSGTLDLPLGARDGSESVFVADEDGGAQFQHRFRPCLEMSDVWTTAMLAINYHSDGRTYMADPGPFGLGSHIPLFLMLPNREGL